MRRPVHIPSMVLVWTSRHHHRVPMRPGYDTPSSGCAGWWCRCHIHRCRWRAFACKLLDMLTQRHLLGIGCHAQTHLSRLTANRAHHGRTIIGKGTTSPLFVGATRRWIVRIKVFSAFFRVSKLTPHSEITRRFQNGCREWRFRVEAPRHWLANDDATSAPSYTPGRVRVKVERWIALAKTRVAAIPPGMALTGCLQIACHCTNDKFHHTGDTDTPATHCPHWRENSVLSYTLPDNTGISILQDENASAAKPHSLLRLGGL